MQDLVVSIEQQLMFGMFMVGSAVGFGFGIVAGLTMFGKNLKG